MEGKAVNSTSGPVASGGYAQAYEVTGGSRTLYISGQIPVRRDGSIPNGFVEQARVAWKNVEAQLKAAGMTLDNIVKHTTYLSDRKYSDENGEVRREILGHRTPALTVIIADIYVDEWLLEVGGIAVA
jgi:enamine deaminase RidA (YjgF/YER057c/UK114 family)